jgi:hypothetical protein
LRAARIAPTTFKISEASSWVDNAQGGRQHHRNYHRDDAHAHGDIEQRDPALAAPVHR